MQLYHHPYSLDSQKVRLALEEKGIDYTSNHVNPITGKNMDASFFGINQSAKLPVFQNGSHIIFDTIEIIQYVSSFAFPFLPLFYRVYELCLEAISNLTQSMDVFFPLVISHPNAYAQKYLRIKFELTHVL